MNNQDCNRCVRRKASTQVVWPTLVPGAKLLIVGEAPGKQEDSEGCGFVGNAGGVLRQQLLNLGVDPTHEVSYANAVACYGGNISKKPTRKEMDACSKLLWRTVRNALKSGTEIVVAAGKYAHKTLVGCDCKITEENGRRKTCMPPREIWHAIQMEDFSIERQIPFPAGEDGFDPKKVEDAAYRMAYVEPLFKAGLVLEEPVEVKVVPSYHPSYFLYDRSAEIHKLTAALRTALIWGGNFKQDVVDKDYKAIFDWQEAVEYMDWLIQAYEREEFRYIALDLEAVGPDDDKVAGALNPFAPGGKVITINLSHKEDFARVIYMNHPEATMTVHEQAKVAEKYRELLEKVPIAGANLKFDLHWSRFKFGVRKWQIAHDTQLMNYAVYLGTAPNDLKTLASRYLSADAGYEDEVRQYLSTLKPQERHYDNIPTVMLTNYAAHDVDVVVQLVPRLIDQLEANHQYQNYIDFLIHPYDAFIEMEQNGAYIDANIANELREEYEKKVQEPIAWFWTQSPYWQEWRARREADARRKREAYKTEKARNKPIKDEELELNFGSPHHMAELLFDIVQLPTWGALGTPKKALMHIFPQGVPTTGVEALENIREQLVGVGETNGPRIELLDKILQHRKDAKILSSYLKKAFEHCPVTEVPDWWENRVTLSDSRAYEAELYTPFCQSARYNLTRARTGRTTSSDPNAQQISSSMRRMYPARPIPPSEKLLEMGLDPEKNPRRLICNFDVGQAELRMLAVASQDQEFLKIMSDPARDVHREVASIAHRKPQGQISKEERADTKRVVFGTAYGRSPQGVASQLKIPVAQAQGIQDALFQLMPQTKRWIEERHEEGQLTGRVITPTGRIRDLTMYFDRGERNRRAVNTPIQGGASDLTLWATGWVHKEIQRQELKSQLWTFVHDSIVFDAFPEELERLMVISRHYFTTETPKRFTWYNVPLVLEFEFGTDWAKQVPAEYDAQTRILKLEATPDKLTPVFEAIQPMLTDVQFDPDWGAHAAAVDKDGNPDPEPVWVSGRFA